MGTVESHPVRLEQGCPRVRPASHAREALQEAHCLVEAGQRGHLPREHARPLGHRLVGEYVPHRRPGPTAR
jgi:hypothetical protein